MLTKLHLISPPWAPIDTPSTQLGALKAYVDREFSGSISTRSYSAFLEILYRYRESSCSFFYKDIHFVGEQIFTLIYHKRFFNHGTELSRAQLGRYLSNLESFLAYYREPRGQKFSVTELEALESSTEAYVDDKIIPELIEDGVNVIGFTMNFSQVYSSLVMAKMIEEKAKGKKLLFLYGGFSASLSDIFALLGKLKIPGYVVFGEGEQKLRDILSDVCAQKKFQGTLSQSIAGVFRIGKTFTGHDENLFRSQVDDIGELPIPDYDEYFSLYEHLADTDFIFKKLVPAKVAIEGSRGCFAKCDFCNLNSQWKGFRKLPGQAVMDRVIKLRARHRNSSFFFVDNVCDAWAEKFAELVITKKLKISFFMNLRAHHPEMFWKKLAAAGMEQCQIGIETLSASLLQKMSKGTLIIQNLKVLKYLSELGVRSGSGIITRHPKATSEDAIETLRILEELSHLEPLEPRRYALGIGSPLHDTLSPEVRKELVPLTVGKLPKKLHAYTAASGCVLPSQYVLSEENNDLWLKVEEYCRSHIWSAQEKRSVFQSEECADGSLQVIDTRFGKRSFRLEGIRAKIFNFCHEGLRVEMLAEKLCISASEVQKHLDAMVAKRLLLCADRYYLTVALRTVGVKQNAIEATQPLFAAP